MASIFTCPSCKCPIDDSTPSLDGLICPFCEHRFGSAPTHPGVPRGALTGWRAFYVKENGGAPVLLSQGYGGSKANGAWTHGDVMVAKCANGHAHKAPDPGCSCGYYSARTREHLLTMSYHRYDHYSRACVIGEISVFGDVVLASNGFRAEKVAPKKLYVPFDLTDERGAPRNAPGLPWKYWELAVELKKVYGPYGIEVVQENTLALPAETAPKWCGKCGSKLKHRDPTCGLCGHTNAAIQP